MENQSGRGKITTQQNDDGERIKMMVEKVENKSRNGSKWKRKLSFRGVCDEDDKHDEQHDRENRSAIKHNLPCAPWTV